MVGSFLIQPRGSSGFALNDLSVDQAKSTSNQLGWMACTALNNLISDHPGNYGYSTIPIFLTSTTKVFLDARFKDNQIGIQDLFYFCSGSEAIGILSRRTNPGCRAGWAIGSRIQQSQGGHYLTDH